MTIEEQVQRLRTEVLQLKRLVIEGRRDLGPLQDVTTVEEFRKHWTALSKTPEGMEYIKNWFWKFALHSDEGLRLKFEDADKILDAISKVEE